MSVQEPLLKGDGGAVPSQPGGLVRDLAYIDGLGLVAGIIVGSGIFASPGVVIAAAGSVGFGMVCWAVASVLATFSSLVYAELATAYVSADGDYGYIKRAFGRDAAFCWVWVRCWRWRWRCWRCWRCCVWWRCCWRRWLCCR